MRSRVRWDSFESFEWSRRTRERIVHAQQVRQQTTTKTDTWHVVLHPLVHTHALARSLART